MYLTEHLGVDGQLVDIVLDRAMEVEQGTYPKPNYYNADHGLRKMSTKAFEIENESFAIIDSEVGVSCL